MKSTKLGSDSSSSSSPSSSLSSISSSPSSSARSDDLRLELREISLSKFFLENGGQLEGKVVEEADEGQAKKLFMRGMEEEEKTLAGAVAVVGEADGQNGSE